VAIDSPILVFDSSGLCYAALHTLGELRHGNVATGIVFGFLGRVLSLGTLFKTNRCVFCWDSQFSIRGVWFEDYKKKRHEKVRTPEEIRERQVMFQQRYKLQHTILPSIGFRNSFNQRGYEADDLMARLCQDSQEDVVLVTSDNDMYQLLRPGIRMYSPTTDKIITHKSFEEKHGIAASRWAEAKSLMGCDGDEVPGVPGIGKVRAIQAIRKELPEKSKAYQSIHSKEGQAIIKRNERLVRLPLPGTKPLDLVPDEFEIKDFVRLCKSYGFQSFGSRLAEWETFFSGRFF